MDEEIAPRGTNEEPLELGTHLEIDPSAMSNNNNEGPFTFEKFIAALEVTTTLKRLGVTFNHAGFKSTSERNRRAIEALCRCFANLRRRHNQNHPLRELHIHVAKNDDRNNFEQFLVAAKQFGIYYLSIFQSRITMQSLVEFCRDNTPLKVLNLYSTRLFDEVSPVAMMSTTQQDDKDGTSAMILTLDELHLNQVDLDNALVRSKFSNFLAHVTYTELKLGKITMRSDDDDGKEKKGGCGADVVDDEDENEETKIARLRVVSELLQPSVEKLTLYDNFPFEVMAVMEACATVTRIQFNVLYPPNHSDMPQKLQAIATRNRELARFVTNPGDYPADNLLVLMRQFDRCPTGRYMLARCFPGIDSFFKIQRTDSATAAGPKKKKRKY